MYVLIDVSEYLGYLPTDKYIIYLMCTYITVATSPTLVCRAKRSVVCFVVVIGFNRGINPSK